MEDFIQRIRECGVVGAGGAGFPTHIKIGGKAEFVLINGAECEPLLRVDQQLMALEAGKLLKGLDLIVKQVQAKEGIIVLKRKYKEATDFLSVIIKNYPQLKLHFLDNFYPAGDEQVLVYETLERIVPEGGIPLDVNTIVCNVETVLNIYDAYTSQTPVVSTCITITGEVARPLTVKVPIGISVKEALEIAGGPLIDEYAVINGGPMMGKVVVPTDSVTKTTKGLIVLPSNHVLVNSLTKEMSHMLREAKTACMNCSLCSETCPRSLLGHRLPPHKLMRIASYGSLCDKEQTPANAHLCTGCRLCEYVCVMNLQPWKLNGKLKEQLSKAGVKLPNNKQPDHVDQFREYKRFPINKLIMRLGINQYDKPAPYERITVDFQRVDVPLKQHVGAPATAVVKIGDTVKKGQVIGKIADGSMGALIHASIDGKIVDITMKQITIEATHELK